MPLHSGRCRVNENVIEVQNLKNELYTQQLLLGVVQQRIQLPSPQLFDEILEEARRFCDNASFGDDVCLVGMDLTGTI